MTTPFVSLHNQTHFSILDSLISPKALFNRAKELGQNAIAITDHGSLAYVWDAFKASNEADVKLIVGCECYFLNDATKTGDMFRHIILLAKNAIGYRNLLTINKKGFDQGHFLGKRVYPIVDWKLLEQYNEGLICLTACGNGIVSQLLTNGKFDEAEQTILKLKEIFKDNLGLEVQPNKMQRGSNIFNDKIDQDFLNRRLIDLGKKHQVRVVPACNAHYLKKEDGATHDVFLAIGAHQPIHSNYRLRYPVPEFYLKDGDEVKAFFARNWGEEYALELCANTIYFADMCEKPDWVDPKFSNPSGKELPIFPVKDEPDYEEFLTWLNFQNDYVKNLSQDKSFLRFKISSLFNQKIVEDKLNNEELPIYQTRIDKELDVLETLDLSSYMLITADFLNYARNNNILIGPGRGCLEGSTKVLTKNGFKNLSNIKIGDEVFTHTGFLEKVQNKFEYEVNEECLAIKTENSFNDLVLTKDHKVFAIKKIINKRNRVFYNKLNEPSFIEAHALEKGDFVFTPFVLRDIEDPKLFSLKKYVKKGIINNDRIEYKIANQFINKKLFIKDHILCDENFMYLCGLFVGDGFYSYTNRGIGLSLNKKDIDIALRIKNYLDDLGFNCKLYYKKENAIQLQCDNELIYDLFSDIFSDYAQSSQTKHLPLFFRNLSNKLLNSLLLGIIDSDGYRAKKHSSITITTTSNRLALELKELLLYLNVPSSIINRKISLKGVKSRLPAFSIRFILSRTNKSYINDDGFLTRIIDIKNKTVNKVYDISVDNDFSYITSNCAVHNSAGGSYIAYLLNIHCADSIKYDLVFERFHNKLKKATSDIDNDIAPSGRKDVIRYVTDKYGADNVAHVCNFNKNTPKVYIKDVARACELGGSKEEAVKLGMTVADTVAADISSIDEALVKSPLFGEYCKRYPELLQYKDICNKPRAIYTAAGVVIGSRPLVGLVPVRKDKEGNACLEYDKDSAEENGLVKIDFLGLNTLDIISATLSLIKEAGKEIPNINFKEYDKKTYDLISSGNTFGVFQFGTSPGTIDLCKKIKPTSLEDLAIITTLARPASREIRNDFILTREGKKKMILLHPILENAFKKTYGFPLYDESLLTLAKDVAGWDLDEADKLRKLTKEKGKSPKKVKQWRDEFISGAIKNGLNEIIASNIWEKIIEPFGKYSFNKSHAILYSIVSFQTAYLKAHYPIEFLLANLMAEVNSNSPDSASNIDKIKKELRANKVKITPPNINESKLTYVLSGENKLLTGLDALKFVGEDAIKDIIEKRPFDSFLDFMARVDSKKVRSNAIQALASAGCMDQFKIPRKLIYLYVSDYRKKLQVWLKKHDHKTEEFIYPWPKELDWKISELYALEHFYLGESFACKSHDAYGDFFKGDQKFIYDLKKAKNKTKMFPIKVIIKSFFEFKVKKETSKYYGQPMIKAIIEDKNGDQCSCTIFPDRWKMVQEKIKSIGNKNVFEPGIAMNFSGSANVYEDEVGVILDDIFSMSAPPALPSDLKAKKINLKEIKAKVAQLMDKTFEVKDLVTQIEDALYDEGLIDLEEETE